NQSRSVTMNRHEAKSGKEILQKLFKKSPSSIGYLVATRNSMRPKRLRLYADNNTHMAHSPNIRSDISQPIVEEFPVPSSGVDDTVVQLDEWSIRRADSVIIKPKAVLMFIHSLTAKSNVLQKEERVVDCRQRFKAGESNRTRFKIDLFQVYAGQPSGAVLLSCL
ncbi:6024_t:CDS:2, partial [Acaulospora colombiana]